MYLFIIVILLFLTVKITRYNIVNLFLLISNFHKFNINLYTGGVYLHNIKPIAGKKLKKADFTVGRPFNYN